MKLSAVCFVALMAYFVSDSAFVLASEAGILATDSVEIKQQGQNSLEAKEKALVIAMRKAFSELLDDRLQISSRDSVFSTKEISDCVYDCSIENEKYSESTYICEIVYRFDRNKVMSLLNKRRIVCKSGTPNSPTSIRLAVYIDDFIKNSKKLNCTVEKFSSVRVIFTLKNQSIDQFRKLGLPYAQL